MYFSYRWSFDLKAMYLKKKYLILRLKSQQKLEKYSRDESTYSIQIHTEKEDSFFKPSCSVSFAVFNDVSIPQKYCQNTIEEKALSLLLLLVKVQEKQAVIVLTPIVIWLLLSTK